MLSSPENSVMIPVLCEGRSHHGIICIRDNIFIDTSTDPPIMYLFIYISPMIAVHRCENAPTTFLSRTSKDDGEAPSLFSAEFVGRLRDGRWREL